MALIDNILEELKQEITARKNLDSKYLESKGNSNGFEKLMQEEIIEEFNSKATSLFHKDIELIPQFKHHFPDIDLKVDNELYGIELKSRNNGSWSTLGGSVIESISDDNYKEIYLLFATFNKKQGDTEYQVRYMPYWKAADAIKVTHSPRFEINLDATNHVFKSNEDYKKLRQLNEQDTIKFIQDALKRSTKKLTWYASLNNEVPPTRFSTLDKSTKDNIKAEVLVLFPYDLLRTIDNEDAQANYTNLQDYLMTQHYISSTRDNFSAGGQVTIHGVKFPRIVDVYQKYKNEILRLLNTNDSEFIQLAYEKWQLPDSEAKHTLEEDFKTVLNMCGNKYLANHLSQANVATLSDLIF